MQKLQPALRAYLQKLREEAYIDIKPGYIDTGASPNQTKPVETTAKEAGAKELKKKRKSWASSKIASDRLKLCVLLRGESGL